MYIRTESNTKNTKKRKKKQDQNSNTTTIENMECFVAVESSQMQLYEAKLYVRFTLNKRHSIEDDIQEHVWN